MLMPNLEVILKRNWQEFLLQVDKRLHLPVGGKQSSTTSFQKQVLCCFIGPASVVQNNKTSPQCKSWYCSQLLLCCEEQPLAVNITCSGSLGSLISGLRIFLGKDGLRLLKILSYSDQISWQRINSSWSDYSLLIRTH